jgi:hypothetical protein
VEEISLHHRDWAEDYEYHPSKNEFVHKSHVDASPEEAMVDDWFTLD